MEWPPGAEYVAPGHYEESFKHCLLEYGQWMEYFSPGATAGQRLFAYFRQDFELIEEGEYGQIATTVPMVLAWSSDFASPPEDGAQFLINTVMYDCATPQPNGLGALKIPLRNRYED